MTSNYETMFFIGAGEIQSSVVLDPAVVTIPLSPLHRSFNPLFRILFRTPVSAESFLEPGRVGTESGRYLPRALKKRVLGSLRLEQADTHDEQLMSISGNLSIRM